MESTRRVPFREKGRLIVTYTHTHTYSLTKEHLTMNTTCVSLLSCCSDLLSLSAPCLCSACISESKGLCQVGVIRLACESRWQITQRLVWMTPPNDTTLPPPRYSKTIRAYSSNGTLARRKSRLEFTLCRIGIDISIDCIRERTSWRDHIIKPAGLLVLLAAAVRDVVVRGGRWRCTTLQNISMLAGRKCNCARCALRSYKIALLNCSPRSRTAHASRSIGVDCARDVRLTETPSTIPTQTTSVQKNCQFNRKTRRSAS